MSCEIIDKKIDKLKNRIKLFIEQSDGGVEGVHKIRTSSREVLSLLSKEKLHCLDLKKVLKLSNKSLNTFVKFSTSLTVVLSSTLCILSDERKKELEVFLEYLHQFFNQNIEFLEKVDVTNDEKIYTKPELSFNIKELHKYRIFIKNQLYITKNTDPDNKDKIQLLTKIKDILGYINDNHNALKIIKKISPDKKSIRELKEFTKNQNLEYFRSVEHLVSVLENEI
jgi:hypothetical protein